MDSVKEKVAFWSTILGAVLGLFAVIQSLTWLMAVSAFVVCASIVALVYAWQQRLRVKSAVLKVSGRSIDSLNVAGLRRRTNRSLVIQEAKNWAIIDGEDLSVTWKCTGYCQADRETAIEFSIDADTNTPFEDLDCVAYDTRRDPTRRYPIQPILLGPDGISKKIAVPFLAPLSAKEPFDVVLKCRLPGCMKAGVEYYTATLSFDQDRIERYTMRLVFLQDLPQWVRAYECRADGDVKLLKALRPLRKTADTCEYLDSDSDVAARAARIYVFSREPLSVRAKVPVDAAA